DDLVTGVQTCALPIYPYMLCTLTSTPTLWQDRASECSWLAWSDYPAGRVCLCRPPGAVPRCRWNSHPVRCLVGCERRRRGGRGKIGRGAWRGGGGVAG